MSAPTAQKKANYAKLVTLLNNKVGKDQMDQMKNQYLAQSTKVGNNLKE